MVISLDNRTNPEGNDCPGESHTVEGTVCGSNTYDVTQPRNSNSELNKDAIL